MYETNPMFSQDNLTRFKDIDEGLRFKIVDFLGKAHDFRASGEIVKSYSYLRSIFELIQPSEFKHRELLINYTDRINQYVNELGVKPIDMRHKLEINNQEYELKDLISDYFRLLPQSLKELGLYLRFLKNRDDPDEQFSEETFNTNKSLLEAKKKILKQLKSEKLLGFMTARTIHDVHARILVEISLRKNREEMSNG